MNKSQTAVTAIILTVMALMMWYLLWIPPQQRYELLIGSDESSEEQENAEQELSYFSAKVGEIGMSNGTILLSTKVSDMRVSYSSIRKLLSSYELTSLDATLFYQGSTSVNINDDYSMVELELSAGNVVGTPKIVVVMNGTAYYENELMSNSKVSVKMPFTNINSKGKEIEILCKFNGNSMFNSQKCIFDSIKLYNYEYYAEKISDSKTFYLNPNAALAEMLELSFNAAQFTEYELAMKINDRQVFEGSLNNLTNKLSIDLSEVPLNDAANTLSIEASKGAEYYLSNISMKFYSLPMGISERYFVFDLPESALQRSNIIIYFNVSGIIQSGDIHFNLLSKEGLFIYPKNRLVLGVNQYEIPIRYFSKNANNLKISSPNGRILINNIKVYE